VQGGTEVDMKNSKFLADNYGSILALIKDPDSPAGKLLFFRGKMEDCVAATRGTLHHLLIREPKMIYTYERRFSNEIHHNGI
jgi:hypothetical protein